MEYKLPGLGVFNTIGEFPNEAETKAIINAYHDQIKKEPFVPIPDPVKPQLHNLGPIVGEGPLGIVPQEIRQHVRDFVETQDGVNQFLLEAGPSAVGSGVGALIGTAALPGQGTYIGAMAGGGMAEVAAQEIGLAPKSPANVAISALSPLAAPILSAPARATGRAIGGLIGKLPPAKVARAKNALAESVSGVESFGTKILNKGKDVLSKVPGAGKVRIKSANELYEAAKASGVVIRPDQLKNTRAAIDALKKEMEPFKAIDEVKQALKLLEVQESILFKGNLELSFKELIIARKAAGIAIRKARNGMGEKLGSAKLVFKGISDDLDELAKLAPTKRAANMAKTASRRAKLEFSVRDLEFMIAKHTKAIPNEEGLSINFKGVLNDILKKSNPKSKSFDKNFSDALKDDLPGIKKNLTELMDIMGAGGPGGPSSLVVRGIGAKTGRGLMGALVGHTFFGPVGLAIGAIAGASGPEIMVAVFTSKAGMAFLKGAAKLGRGEVSREVWIIAVQIALRSAGTSTEEIEKVLDSPEIEEESPPERPGDGAGETVFAEPIPTEKISEEKRGPLEEVTPQILDALDGAVNVGA